MKTDYDALGLPYDPPAVRVDRFEEALHVIKQCFTGEQFSITGEHYRITDYASCPKPVQQPGPPILIGGGGKRVLSIAAREADIVGINPNLRAGEIGARRGARLAAGADRPQDRSGSATRPARASTTSRSRCASSSRASPTTAWAGRSARARVRRRARRGARVGRRARRQRDEIIEQLHRRREEWGLSYVVVGDDNVDEFAPDRRQARRHLIERRSTSRTAAGIHVRRAVRGPRRRTRVSRWPAPGSSTISPCPASICTTLLVSGGRISSSVPCRSSSGVSPSWSACSQPADCVDERDDARGSARRAPRRPGPRPRRRTSGRWSTKRRRAAPAREIGRRRDVVHAAAQVVRLAVADAHRADAVLPRARRRGRGTGRRPGRAGCPCRRRT